MTNDIEVFEAALQTLQPCEAANLKDRIMRSCFAATQTKEGHERVAEPNAELRLTNSTDKKD